MSCGNTGTQGDCASRAELEALRNEVAQLRAEVFEILAIDCLSEQQVADCLGVSLRSVWRLIKDGTLKGRKVRGRTVVRRIDVAKFLEENVKKCTPKTNSDTGAA